MSERDLRIRTNQRSLVQVVAGLILASAVIALVIAGALTWLGGT